MKVFSPYAYNLPDGVSLPQGESEIGEMPSAAKKHLDGLIAAGVVKVTDAPSVDVSVGSGGAGGSSADPPLRKKRPTE